MNILLFFHVWCTITCLGADLYETNLDNLGTLFRGCEVITVGLNSCITFYGMTLLFTYFGFQA